MATLRFPLSTLKPILEWAKHNPPANYPYTKDPAPSGLLFVKDAGIYLMANTDPRQMRGDDLGAVACFADGYGPDADYEAVRLAAGGDDFAEFLPLIEVLRVINAAPNDKWFVIGFDPDSDSFTCTSA